MSEDLTRFRLLRTPLLADRVCDAFEDSPFEAARVVSSVGRAGDS